MSESGLAAPASLPLITLHLTERCNSRCISCDYWRHGTSDISLATVESLLPDLERLGTRLVLLSGGEPLLHRDCFRIADRLRSIGLRLWLHTSGLALAKHAARVVKRFDDVTVSLDAADRESYMRIRGVDAFDVVCEGVRRLAKAGQPPSLRVTVQRANYTELPRLVELAHTLGAARISFLAVDVANPYAFARDGSATSSLALDLDDLPRFDATLAALERSHAVDFANGFIAERQEKLRRLLIYFRAVRGQGPFPKVRCNVADFSAVITATGRVNPCFFIPGPTLGEVGRGLARTWHDESMQALRERIRTGTRPECARCVCSMWRDPDQLTALVGSRAA